RQPHEPPLGPAQEIDHRRYPQPHTLGSRKRSRPPMMGRLRGRTSMAVTWVRSRVRGRGGLVTVGTVVALVCVMAVTLFGIGAANNAIANYDASSWMWSTNKGEVARVNGVTGRVDTRFKVTDSQGHTVQVTQTDRYVILRDLTTGKVSVLDLSTLQVAA